MNSYGLKVEHFRNARQRVALAIMMGVLASGAFAQTEKLELNADIETIVADGPTPTKATVAFGKKGSERLTFSAGIAPDGSEGTDYQILAISYSSFMDNGVELLAEVGTWFFDQEGNNAGGGSLTLGARWHVVNKPKWSLFADIGIGALVSTDVVPEGGTGLNFMPRLGVGSTFAIGDTGVRAVVGLRGHHISNARILGDVANPSRDALMVYAGISFPF